MVACIKKIMVVCAFIVLMPVMLLVALLIRINLGSPIFFKQKRIGLNNHPFTLYKFRTMRNLYSTTGELLEDEQRLTTIGRILRKFSLDELPQLWNVIRGDIVMVGPRPMVTDILDSAKPEHVKRHHVKPGITGWAQINGRNAISHDMKFQLDLWYVENKSLWLDIKILLKTIPLVLSGKNINKPDAHNS